MMTDFPDPPPPLAEPKGGITECVNKTLPGLLDVVERALPLGRFSLVFGEAGLHVNVPQCPLWFDGERVHCDLHPHSPYVNVVVAQIQAYAMALGLGRVGHLPTTADEVGVFENALYLVYFEAKKHHTFVAETFRRVAMDDLRGWLRQEMESVRRASSTTTN